MHLSLQDLDSLYYLLHGVTMAVRKTVETATHCQIFLIHPWSCHTKITLKQAFVLCLNKQQRKLLLPFQHTGANTHSCCCVGVDNIYL